MTKFLKNLSPLFRKDEKDVVTAFNITESWNNSNLLCRNYILNGLSDELYEVYSIKKTTKGP
ncbi:hypothetical protein J1N35_021029 [Gossypium stocksii]|uniref:Uncharacterized protein n=1 Tax=Gossypium stocksii TaxID=47602 RepID=A0A9D3VDS9_9ROSI|nr:hypothetical protein J1N35_021029 [Gossypium stocksii]